MRRKIWKKKVMSGILAVSLLLGLAACGAGDAGSKLNEMVSVSQTAASSAGSYADSFLSEDSAAEEYVEGAEYEAVTDSGSGMQSYYDSRKLIRTIYLDLETKEFDGLLALVEERTTSMGGYIETLQTYNGSRYSNRETTRNSDLILRIPKDRLDEFLNSVSEVGNVISRSESVEDVTLAYVDMESRRNTLQTEQERLLTFLESAESLEDIIALEERLSEVRYQLESMESQLRTYDNKVEFATVHMSIQEVKELTPVKKLSTGQRIAEGFQDSLENIGDGLVEFFVWFVVHLPYLVIWVLVLAVIVISTKLIIRCRRKKKAARQKESEK